MNEDIFKGKWKQIKGDVKAKWGKLTDSELDLADGDSDKFIGKIQEKYGHTKEEIRSQINKFLDS